MNRKFLAWARRWIEVYREDQERWSPSLKWDYDRVMEVAEQIATRGVEGAWLELDRIKNPYSDIMTLEDLWAFRGSRSGISVRTDNMLEQFIYEAIDDHLRTVNVGEWCAHWAY